MRLDWFVYFETELEPILLAILVNSRVKDCQNRIKFVDDTTVLVIILRCSLSLFSCLSYYMKLALLLPIVEWDSWSRIKV